MHVSQEQRAALLVANQGYLQGRGGHQLYVRVCGILVQKEEKKKRTKPVAALERERRAEGWSSCRPTRCSIREIRYCLDFAWLMLDLIRGSLRRPGRARRSLCASPSHAKRTEKRATWGSELFGGLPAPSHRHICMWNRHFTPPHSLIVAKIICEIAFHQECLPRQLSRFYMRGGPTEVTHAALPLCHVRSLIAARFGVCACACVCIFLTITFQQLLLACTAGQVNLLSSIAGRSNVVITTHTKKKAIGAI